MTTKSILPSRKLTFIIRDSAPFFNLQEPVSHRTVQIDLTTEQLDKLKLYSHSSQGFGENTVYFYEEISMIINELEGENHDQSGD